MHGSCWTIRTIHKAVTNVDGEQNNTSKKCNLIVNYLGRGSVRTWRRAYPSTRCRLLRAGPRAPVDPPEQIENENDDDDEKDCSKLRAMLKAVGRGSVRTGRRASPFDALSLAQGRPARSG
jgi:hypothetical protein